MLESKNDNKDRNDIDIDDNTSGTVGFDPKTGKVFYVDEPKEKEEREEDIEEEAEILKDELNKSTEEIKDLLKSVGIDDPTDIKSLKKLAEAENED